MLDSWMVRNTSAMTSTIPWVTMVPHRMYSMSPSASATSTMSPLAAARYSSFSSAMSRCQLHFARIHLRGRDVSMRQAVGLLEQGHRVGAIFQGHGDKMGNIF